MKWIDAVVEVEDDEAVVADTEEVVTVING